MKAIKPLFKEDEVNLDPQSSDLLWAAQNGHADIVKQLLDKGATVDVLKAQEKQSPLHLAACNGHVAVLELLLDKRADINLPMPSGATSLYIAAQHGHLTAVEFLVGKGADINRAKPDGSSPLHVAAQKGHADIVKQLLDKGATVDALTTPEKISPLHLAAYKGHVAVLESLLDKRADINLPMPSGATSLYIAAQHGHLTAVEFLVGKGADINRAKPDGSSPLHVAAEYGHADIVKYIWDNTANKASLWEFCNPLKAALKNGNQASIEFLEQGMVDHNAPPELIYEAKAWSEQPYDSQSSSSAVSASSAQAPAPLYGYSANSAYAAAVPHLGVAQLITPQNQQASSVRVRGADSKVDGAINHNLTSIGDEHNFGRVLASHNFAVNGFRLPAENMPELFVYIDEKGRLQIIKDLATFKLDNNIPDASVWEVMKVHPLIKKEQKQAKKAEILAAEKESQKKIEELSRLELEEAKKQALLQEAQKAKEAKKQEEQAQRERDAEESKAAIERELESKLETSAGCIELLKASISKEIQSNIDPKVRDCLINKQKLALENAVAKKAPSAKKGGAGAFQKLDEQDNTKYTLPQIIKSLKTALAEEAKVAAATPIDKALVLSKAIDENGDTLLHRAVFYAADEKGANLVSLLNDNGADVDVQNAKGFTPIMLACMKPESWNMVRMLVNKSRDLSKIDGNDCNALHHLLRHDIADSKQRTTQSELFKLIIDTQQSKQPGDNMLFTPGLIDGSSKSPKVMIDSKKGVFGSTLKHPLEEYLARKGVAKKPAHVEKTEEIGNKIAEKQASRAKAKQLEDDEKLAKGMHESESLTKARQEAKAKKDQEERDQQSEVNLRDLLGSGKVHAPDSKTHVVAKKPTLINKDHNPLTQELELALANPATKSKKAKKAKAQKKLEELKVGSYNHSSNSDESPEDYDAPASGSAHVPASKPATIAPASASEPKGKLDPSASAYGPNAAGASSVHAQGAPGGPEIEVVLLGSEVAYGGWVSDSE